MIIVMVRIPTQDVAVRTITMIAIRRGSDGEGHAQIDPIIYIMSEVSRVHAWAVAAVQHNGPS